MRIVRILRKYRALEAKNSQISHFSQCKLF